MGGSFSRVRPSRHRPRIGRIDQSIRLALRLSRPQDTCERVLRTWRATVDEAAKCTHVFRFLWTVECPHGLKGDAVSHPPNPPVDYVGPRRARRYPWRPLWLRLLLPLRIPSLVRLDAARRQRYEDEQRFLSDESIPPLSTRRRP